MTTRTYSVLFWLAVVGFLSAYLAWINAPFYLDDYTSILENPAIVNTKTLGDFFSNSSLSRFVVDLSFYLNYRISGSSEGAFRLINILLHVANSLLVFELVRRLISEHSAAKNIALIAAVVFLLHPLNTQAVTYIVQRYTEVSTLFVLLGLLCLNKAYVANSKLWPILGWISCLLLAFLSKQNGLVLIPISLMVGMYLAKERAESRKLLIGLTSLLLLALIAVNIEPIQSLTREAIGVSRVDYFLTQGPVIWLYWLKMVIPYGLHLESDLTVSSFPLWVSLLAWLAHFIVVAIGMRLLLKRSLIGVGLLIMYGAQCVESSIIPISDVYFEHRAYLSIVGFGMVVATLLNYFKNEKQLALLALSIVVVYSGLTYYRNYQWANPTLFYKNETEYAPLNERVKNELARQYVIAEEYQAGAKLYAEILNDPKVSKTESILVNAMVAFYNINRSDLVLQLVGSSKSSFNQFKPNTRARINRLMGRIKYDGHEYDHAIRYLKRTHALFPKDRLTLSLLSKSYSEIGAFDKSENMLERLSGLNDSYYREARLLFCKASKRC